MNLLIFAFCFTVNAIILDAVQPTSVVTVIYRKGIKLDKIQEPGTRFEYKRRHTSQMDSVVTSGIIIMKKSKIGLIKNCTYSWDIENDTLSSVIVKTFKTKNTLQLLNQATSQYGIPTEIHGVDNMTYTWTDWKEMTGIHTRLDIDQEAKTGVLKVTTIKRG